MKKILLCYFIFCFVFFIPLFLANTKRDGIEVLDDTEKNENSNFYINSNINIRLLHKTTGEVENVDLENYIVNVVSAEMPVSFEIEALKAQAVVARTYTMFSIGKGKHEEADLCDDSSCCQAWISKENRMNKWEEAEKYDNWNKIEKCVNDTNGIVIKYNDEYIDSFFHSNSGGKTENVSTVWGGTDLPYLKSVETSGEDAYSQYSSEVEISKQEFEEKIKNKYSDFEINYQDGNCIDILEKTEGDRVKKIKVGNLELSGVEIRTLIGLKSAKFEVEIFDNSLKFKVVGYRTWSGYESNWCRCFS